jgi:hypothetical protein
VHKDNAAPCNVIEGGQSQLPNMGRGGGGVTRARAVAAARGREAAVGCGGGRGGDAAPTPRSLAKELRDPRGYIMSADQPDFGNAVDFVNALIKSGVTVMKATARSPSTASRIPNSIVVKANQAFRLMVPDMFEPRTHPDDFDNNGNPIAHA